MKKLFITTVLLLLLAPAFSQTIMYLQDPVSSKIFSMEKYSGIRGTPFLFEKWMKGTVTTPKGVYKDLELKYNVYDNALFFNKDDESFELQDDIITFTLMPKPDDPSTHVVYKKGITGPDFKTNEYVQVLAEGPNAAAYKLDQKFLTEKSEINVGMVKTFAPNSKYYIQRNKSLVFVKLNKSEILNALNDKDEKLNVFIAEKKLTFKKEADLTELVRYYNTL